MRGRGKPGQQEDRAPKVLGQKQRTETRTGRCCGRSRRAPGPLGSVGWGWGAARWSTRGFLSWEEEDSDPAGRAPRGGSRRAEGAGEMEEEEMYYKDTHGRGSGGRGGAGQGAACADD